MTLPKQPLWLRAADAVLLLVTALLHSAPDGPLPDDQPAPEVAVESCLCLTCGNGTRKVAHSQFTERLQGTLRRDLGETCLDDSFNSLVTRRVSPRVREGFGSWSRACVEDNVNVSPHRSWGSAHKRPFRVVKLPPNACSRFSEGQDQAVYG